VNAGTEVSPTAGALDRAAISGDRHIVAAPGRIGPNAILQVLDVLGDTLDRQALQGFLAQAGLTHHLTNPPQNMVDEREVVRLHRAVRSALPGAAGEAVLRHAGVRTARYLLAHRIPTLAQRLLTLLPSRLASRFLLVAISKHAWTFAGSGAFTFEPGKPAQMKLTDCPACEEVYGKDEPCTYYEATLQGLFAALVHPGASVTSLIDHAANRRANPGAGRVRTFRLDW
jgi:divinyl protochlorophyllide a 8-vinyl-reductase